ncbi:hypothetical protein GCM10010406_52600 [Streptomyces thermolineatus]|uniref:Uncharacterized protein n=1 Tax=Streptomyces thermolineatus TaxID=44033 RepID=A0ABN3MV93_9ACTN
MLPAAVEDEEDRRGAGGDAVGAQATGGGAGPRTVGGFRHRHTQGFGTGPFPDWNAGPQRTPVPLRPCVLPRGRGIPRCRGGPPTGTRCPRPATCSQNDGE